jgi:enediyne polyketide synthase
MQTDLHFNSIMVGQLVATAARQLELLGLTNLTDFANASVAEVATALEELKQAGSLEAKAHPGALPPGVDHWVRCFTVSLVQTKHRVVNSEFRTRAPGGWQIFAPAYHPLADSLREAFVRIAGSGVIVYLPEHPDLADIVPLLNAGRAVLELERGARFVVVQHGWGGGGFARTLHLERLGATTCLLNVPASHPRTIEWVVAEALAANDYMEVHYTSDGQRLEPRLKLTEMPLPSIEANTLVGPEDVLLVTGGAKGIAAECALAFSRETGVKLAIIGRSDPKSETILAENLARMAAEGVRLDYFRADVCDAKAVCAAVAEIERTMGRITAILHGAGVNTPKLISALTEEDFRQTLRPKVTGLRNLLAAVEAEDLKLLITFGSIIARVGLPGEADYATANEWLSALTSEYQMTHPKCRCLALEWSVWSGVGMGERLGRIESLRQEGVTPIPVEDGVRVFCELLRRRQPATTVVVAGRFGARPTLQVEEPELPLRRFLERPRVFYPGVELVVDAELSMLTDPYLSDHAIGKQSLLPAVLGVEAMAQVAMALASQAKPPVFERLDFLRAISVPENNPITLRLAALRREDGRIEICLRSEESNFQADHFRASCRFAPGRELAKRPPSFSESESVQLDLSEDLYGRILFHKGRFCRLRKYRMLKAKECVAEIKHANNLPWFGGYLPSEFVLGDPAARDAALHALQACIPHRQVLPIRIERMEICDNQSGERIVHAKERFRDGDTFVYDVEITNTLGMVMECWEGVYLRTVGPISIQENWPEALFAPYLERRLEELLGDALLKVAFKRGPREERLLSSNRVMQQALGKSACIWRRPDGKPIVLEEASISAGHASEFTLAVAGVGGAACDLEEVIGRPHTMWRDLLGDEAFLMAEWIAHESAESLDVAATRLWTMVECLKKIGQPDASLLVFEGRTEDGWTLHRSGGISIATCAATVQRSKSPLVAAFARVSAVRIQPVLAHSPVTQNEIRA